MGWRPGTLVSGLARCSPAELYSSLLTSLCVVFTLPRMTHSKVIIYSDGGARGNPGPAAIGVFICDEKGNALQEHHEVIGEATNNIAEYTAVLVGLELAKKLGAREIHYFVDSQLVASQLTGKYRIKTPHIQTLCRQVKEREKSFDRVKFQQVPRTNEGISRADKLVNLALDLAGH